MELHKILTRQLTHLGLNESTLPDLSKWQELLKRINNHYNDSDQDLYLLERSMNLSSQELMELNDKLAESQSLAKIGYWYHDLKSGKNTWSIEIYKMFNFDLSVPAPSLEQALKLIHDDDRKMYTELIHNALEFGESFEVEIRCKVNDDKDPYHWFKVICKPQKSEGEILTVINGVVMDITSSKKAQKEVEVLHQQVVTAARRAGMADVATSILHNIGNILNSVNVSLGLITEGINNENFEKFFVISEMLKNNRNNLLQFLTEDERGKNIPEYLSKLIANIKNNHSDLLKELNELKVQINHIKDITSMQNEIGGVTGVIEKVYLPELVDTAIKMCSLTSASKNIIVTKRNIDNIFLKTDKSKLLQIMVNIIQNAKDALLQSQKVEKKIDLSVQRINENYIEIRCEDNGIGIDKENLISIFSFGFTTKIHGHGFGLHSSALAAKELGGTLEAKTKGKNVGAIFILTLPINSPERSESYGRPTQEKHADYSY